MSKISNHLKVLLAEKQRTNKWLADTLKKDQATVSKWCTNTYQPSLDTAALIAKALGVDLNELVRLCGLKKSWILKKDSFKGKLMGFNKCLPLIFGFSQSELEMASTIKEAISY